MRHTLQNDAPADGFADCYLLGNGALAAAVAVTDAGTGVRLETFVSAVDDVFVARADGASTAAPLLCSPHPVRTTSSTQSGVTWVTMPGRAPANVLPHYVPDDTPVVYCD